MFLINMEFYMKKLSINELIKINGGLIPVDPHPIPLSRNVPQFAVDKIYSHIIGIR